MEMLYQIIPIKENIFDNEIDLSLLDKNFTNIYATGIKTICKIENVRNFPIKNRKIAIKQILTFFKFIETTTSIKNKNNDLIEIPQEEMINIFNRNTYVDFLKLLNELNIFKAIPYDDGTYYNSGKDKFGNKIKGLAKIKRYKLTNEYKNDDLCLVIIDDKKDIKYEVDGNYDKRFIKTINEVGVDIKSAIMDELKQDITITSLRSRLNTLFNLYEKRYIKKGFKVDRIYHSLTNISKVSRKHINIKGKKFINIDIVNCQPLLLCYYLIKNNLEIDNDYIKDCELGSLYEKFLIKGKEYIDYDFIIKNNKIVGKNKKVIKVEYNEIGDDLYNITRKNIKVLMYKCIFFDFKINTDISNMFKELYPKVYSELLKIYEVNKEDELENKCKMAGELQNIEAEIFNSISPKKSKYYFTLFDAIFFTDEDDVGSIMIDILNKFKKYNLVPKLKYNDCISIN
jgi:hypothetical protein